MNFVQQLQIAFSVLLPACLIGPELRSHNENGIFKKYDKKGTAITLEWHKIKDSKIFSQAMKPLIPALADAFADDTKLLRAFLFDENLQAIKQEHLAFLADVSDEMRQKIDAKIQLGGRDRQTRVNCTLASYEQTSEQELAAKWAHNNPFVVIAREGTKVLGVAVFCNTSLESELDLPKNAVYLDELGVISEAQGRGLSKLLIFSVFDLIPGVSQIFLNTGVWNTKAQAVYKAVGFEPRECKEFGHVGFQFIKK
jgi:ribosomal protein S18 acetylase RimI-like enzyme